ncbi:MAG: hypothetical protein NC392_09145 [Roseburia sp.]|nr:hypothetical protein [Roseburia sp.]
MEKRIKGILLAGVLGIAAVLLSACGAQKEAADKAVADGWELVEEVADSGTEAETILSSGEGTAPSVGIGESAGAETDAGNGTAYCEIYERFVTQKEGDALLFSLIYLDVDDIPELVVLDRGYESYSVYTVRDGEIFCMADSMITVEMTYLERGGIIVLFARWNGGGDEGGYGRYYYQVSTDKTCVNDDPAMLNYAYNAVYDEEENWTGEGVIKYYHLGQEIDAAEYQQLADSLGIVEEKEKSCVENASGKEEMVKLLNGQGGAAGDSVKQAAVENSIEQAEDGDNRTVRGAYYDVLDKLYTTYTLPDGTELGYDGMRDLSENTYAIYDVDQDSQEELILTWTTTYTAGMAGIVYGFDSASGTVRLELLEYPMLTFYDNGVAEAGLSHNHGLAGAMPEGMDFWPYFLYQYDKETDTYVMRASVDAWNKAFRDTDYEGNAFPDAIDADGDGVVYIIESGEEKELLDAEDYGKWRDSVIGRAGEIKIPFEPMTGEWGVGH